MSAASGASGSARWEVFSNRGLGPYTASSFLHSFATQIQTVAVGWQVYDITRNPFDLGLVGLSQFAPALLLVLVTGNVADRFPRRTTMSICLALMALVAGGLLWLATTERPEVWLIFVLIALFGTARAFYAPARQSLVTNIVKPVHLSQALALNTSINKFATVFGPVTGGLLYGVAPFAPYLMAFLCMLAASILIAFVPKTNQKMARSGQGWAEVTAGFGFIRRSRLVLGAISLDMFVVLLGGAMAMLPVYARDVLDVGAVGLGMLRAAPAVGAIGVALWLMRRPVRTRAGMTMFLTVALFAVATLVFALSQAVWLSILALIVVGGSDTLSVIIRNTIVQLNTPDILRGRVNAVAQIFVGASNEVGGFRAGSMAALFGPVPAVAGGAVVALGVCGLWAYIFPELRKVSEVVPERDVDD